MSLAKFGGVMPAGGTLVNKRLGIFRISEEDLKKSVGKMTGPVPTQVKDKVPVVERSEVDRWPCNHRLNRIGDTKCGGCGNHGRYVEVFACDLHKSCTVSRPSIDARIRTCSSCKDRSAVDEVDFASLKNIHAGQTITIVGRGETTFPNAHLAQEGPVMFLNDAALLEKYCRPEQPTYMLGQDARVSPVLSGLRSLAIVPRGTGLYFRVAHTKIPQIGKVCFTVKPNRGEDYLLDLDREDLTIERRLYRGPRAPTIGMAIHLAFYVGASSIRFIRCDGHTKGYAKDIPNLSESPEVPSQYAQTKVDAENICKRLGIPFTYVGTPMYDGQPCSSLPLKCADQNSSPAPAILLPETSKA